MQVGHRNACRQGREVRVLLRHVGAGLGRQGIDLRRADAVVEACRSAALQAGKGIFRFQLLGETKKSCGIHRISSYPQVITIFMAGFEKPCPVMVGLRHSVYHMSLLGTQEIARWCYSHIYIYYIYICVCVCVYLFVYLFIFVNYSLLHQLHTRKNMRV